MIILIILYCSIYSYYIYYRSYSHYFHIAGWLESVGFLVVYELDYREPILYVILIQSILVVPVGDTGSPGPFSTT